MYGNGPGIEKLINKTEKGKITNRPTYMENNLWLQKRKEGMIN